MPESRAFVFPEATASSVLARSGPVKALSDLSISRTLRYITAAFFSSASRGTEGGWASAANSLSSPGVSGAVSAATGLPDGGTGGVSAANASKAANRRTNAVIAVSIGQAPGFVVASLNQ